MLLENHSRSFRSGGNQKNQNLVQTICNSFVRVSGAGENQQRPKQWIYLNTEATFCIT